MIGLRYDSCIVGFLDFYTGKSLLVIVDLLVFFCTSFPNTLLIFYTFVAVLKTIFQKIEET